MVGEDTLAVDSVIVIGDGGLGFSANHLRSFQLISRSSSATERGSRARALELPSFSVKKFPKEPSLTI
jgi:hypothetical protein